VKIRSLVPQSGDSGLFIEQEGVREVFQLDGGVLKCFEACGEAHYRGDGFVFDQRGCGQSTARENGHDDASFPYRA